MSKASRSGLSVQHADVPIILAMVARGDRNHDLAAWFGLNQGRIKEVKDGQYGSPSLAPANALPPSGAPGLKARDLRTAVQKIRVELNKGDATTALADLEKAIHQYDKNE